MHKHGVLLMLVTLCMASGCRGGMDSHALLEKARRDYRAALHNPQAVALVPMELKQAGDVLDQAHEALEQRESADRIDTLAALARCKIMQANEKARQLAQEQALSRALKQRDRSRRNVQT